MTSKCTAPSPPCGIHMLWLSYARSKSSWQDGRSLSSGACAPRPESRTTSNIWPRRGAIQNPKIPQSVHPWSTNLLKVCDSVHLTPSELGLGTIPLVDEYIILNDDIEMHGPQATSQPRGKTVQALGLIRSKQIPWQDGGCSPRSDHHVRQHQTASETWLTQEIHILGVAVRLVPQESGS